MIELETLEEFDRYLDGHKSLADTACQGLDLSERTWRLIEADVRCAFLLIRGKECSVEKTVSGVRGVDARTNTTILDGRSFDTGRADRLHARCASLGVRNILYRRSHRNVRRR